MAGEDGGVSPRPTPLILNAEGRTVDLSGKEVQLAHHTPTLKVSQRETASPAPFNGLPPPGQHPSPEAGAVQDPPGEGGRGRHRAEVLRPQGQVRRVPSMLLKEGGGEQKYIFLFLELLA